MVVYNRPTDKCMVRWAKPKGAFERVGCNLRLFKRLLNMLSTLPADPAGSDLEMVSSIRDRVPFHHGNVGLRVGGVEGPVVSFHFSWMLLLYRTR